VAAEMKWLPIAGGVAAGIVGLLIWQGYANAAASPAAPSAPAAATATVNLQPGSTAVAVAPGGSVLLVLPAGASWTTASGVSPITPLPATAVQPAGSQNESIVMGTAVGTYPLTANWVDSSGTAQSTTVNISVAPTA
jgi:hypothetical protein